MSERPVFLYRHFDAAGTLLYAGISFSPYKRTLAHQHSSPWFGRVTRIEIEKFPTRTDAMVAERAVIVEKRPPFNRNDGGQGQRPISTRALTRAQISRRARERAKDGDVVFKLQANRDALILALLEGGWIDERAALDHRQVEHALAELWKFLLLRHADLLRHP
jgi:hypothetical protein